MVTRCPQNAHSPIYFCGFSSFPHPQKAWKLPGSQETRARAPVIFIRAYLFFGNSNLRRYIGGGRFSPLTWNSRELIAFHVGIRRGSASANKENGSTVGCEAKEEPANRVHAIDHFSGNDRRHPADYNSRQTVLIEDSTRTRCRENSIDPLI